MPDNDREYFLRRLKQEIESEGEDWRQIWRITGQALYELVRKLADRLGKTVDYVMNALDELGGWGEK